MPLLRVDGLVYFVNCLQTSPVW